MTTVLEAEKQRFGTVYYYCIYSSPFFSAQSDALPERLRLLHSRFPNNFLGSASPIIRYEDT